MGTLTRSGRCEVATSASPDAVWAIAGDPTRVGEWSHECGGADWVDGATTARPGARFRGRNRVGHSKWTRVNEIVAVDAPREISWRTIATKLYPDSTVWTITVAPTDDGGSTIVQTYQVVKLNPVVERIIYVLMKPHRDRSQALREDLERLGARAAEAEASAPAG